VWEALSSEIVPTTVPSSATRKVRIGSARSQRSVASYTVTFAGIEAPSGRIASRTVPRDSCSCSAARAGTWRPTLIRDEPDVPV
jgi:hypothetical protein